VIRPGSLVRSVALIGVVTACNSAGPTIVPTVSSEDLSACAGIPAPPPSPPDFGPDDAYLDRIYPALQEEVMSQERRGEFYYLFLDGVAHIIVIGAAHPTKELCEDLHERYGPWIRVEQSSGVVEQ
jgi:hypothetical protein